MPRKSIHWRAARDLPSFPNNRLSNRPKRRKVVTRKVWKEDWAFDSPRYPEPAYCDPFCVPTFLDALKMPFQPAWQLDAGGHMLATPCPMQFGGESTGLGVPGMTAWADNQFNPFVAESLPPTIIWMDVLTHYDYHYVGFVKIVDAFWADVTVEVFDPSPFLFTINVGNGYSSFASGQMPHGGSWNFTIPMALSYPSMWASGYVVNVTVLDYSGQFAYMEKEMDGEFSGIIGFLEWVWSGMCGTFAKAWEAVKGAMDIMYHILMKIYMTLFKPMFDSLNATVRNFFNGLLNIVDSSSMNGEGQEALLKGSENQINLINSNRNTAENIVDYILTAQFMIVLISIFAYLELTEKLAKCNPLVYLIIAVIISLFFSMMIVIIDNMNVYITPPGDDGLYVPASMTPPDLSNTVINTLIDVVGVLAAANVYMIVKIKEMKSGKPMKADVAYGLGLAFGSAIMSILSLACLFMDYNPIWAGISLIISACFLIGSGINMIQGITELSTAPIMYMFGVVGFSWSFLQLLFSYKELEYKLIYG